MSITINKKYLVLVLGMALVLLSCYSDSAKAQNPLSFSVMSYNIRYDNPDDAPNNWDNRKESVANLIKFYEPTFVGTQEALFNQLQDLDESLTNYDWIGKGRKDGKKGGEYSAILYDTDQFRLVSGADSTMWLSGTPDKPSKDWDAALPRIITWGKFRHKDTGKELYVFNTHFDHKGSTARVESAKLILKTIKKVAGDAPVILTGDFNVPEDQEPYKIMTNSFLKDALYASKLEHVGPEFTFSGFEVCNSSSHRSRIDYIFINKLLNVNKIATIPNFRQGSFLSDHLPVYGKFTWKK